MEDLLKIIYGLLENQHATTSPVRKSQMYVEQKDHDQANTLNNQQYFIHLFFWATRHFSDYSIDEVLQLVEYFLSQNQLSHCIGPALSNTEHFKALTKALDEFAQMELKEKVGSE